MINIITFNAAELVSACIIEGVSPNEPPLNKAALGVADLAQSSEDPKIKIVRACVRLSRARVYYFKNIMSTLWAKRFVSVSWCIVS